MGRGDTWIDLHANLGVRREGEVPGEAGEHALELLGGVVGRGAAAPVQLRDRPARRKVRGQQVDLALQIVQVPIGHVAVTGNHHVTTTVRAPLLAERQVDVEGQRLVGPGAGVGQAAHVGGIVYARVELDRRWIRGVARPRPIVSSQQPGGHVVHAGATSSGVRSLAACTASTSASTLAMGVSGRMP